jgi:hypothetical protein
MLNTDDWELRLNFATVPSTAGQGTIGFGIIDDDAGEFLTLEYDGTTLTIRAEDSVGAMTVDGTTAAVGSQTWLRIRLTGTTIHWERSTDQATWNSIGTQTIGSNWTNDTTPKWIPIIYWKSIDSDATPATVDIAQFGWHDDQTIPRFGNWCVIQNGDLKMHVMHMRELTVAQGDFIEVAGRQIGTVGQTGFDTISGPILEPHIHLEAIENNNDSYSNDDPVNPLAPGILPRANGDANVSVVRTTANDPDAVDSWKLAITVTRSTEDFDLNLITLTGNLATRTVNFDTRAGLNADNDIPKEAGVYIVPSAFNHLSATYVVDIYFNKSVVGTTFTSYSVQDTEGTVLASE